MSIEADKGIWHTILSVPFDSFETTKSRQFSRAKEIHPLSRSCLDQRYYLWSYFNLNWELEFLRITTLGQAPH